MRASSALLHETAVRLADLEFPRGVVHIHRTRLAFLHLENILHYSKIDRDGRFDGYLAAYLPHEALVLLFTQGELVNAIGFTEAGRIVEPIARALTRFQEEFERGEAVYCAAPREQLAWMYQSCSASIDRLDFEVQRPLSLFHHIEQRHLTGVVELIAHGRVNYLRFGKGRFIDGYFRPARDTLSPQEFVQRLFAAPPAGQRVVAAAFAFPAPVALPVQASPSLVETYRDVFWRIAEVAEREVPGDALKRAVRVRDALAKASQPLIESIGTPRESPPVPMVATPAELTVALADWSHQLLEQLDVIAPGTAVAVLRDATREQRFVLQKAGFYGRLPWTVTW